ncbi:DUF305 domain-containing protein [uncultured Planktosalinus sp.]|uniref:DUF305 domain-containing protein n=1 Tax=uncultured Planktosalinus sp. TaxID=1810935 RepID=UPI0030DDB547|tara:strand:+ start:56 stop:511 length:456 start_codon:yes stop_codon:yes gene_type:complete
MKSYLKFALMMATSFVIMYAVMFLNAASIDHVMLSTMRTYMTLLMIAPMAIVMLLYMWGMYKNKKLNALILVVSIVGFGAVYYMMRNQTGISDVQYMKAMIPHHSSAILTSDNANLQDPETKKLAEDISKLQKEEIALMKAYLDRINKNNN